MKRAFVSLVTGNDDKYVINRQVFTLCAAYLRTVLLGVLRWKAVRGGHEIAFRTEKKRFVGTKRTSYARWNENSILAVLVLGDDVGADADSSTPACFISGPLAHTRSSVLGVLGCQGHSLWLVRLAAPH